jgi:hypothetical protein
MFLFISSSFLEKETTTIMRHCDDSKLGRGGVIQAERASYHGDDTKEMTKERIKEGHGTSNTLGWCVKMSS